MYRILFASILVLLGLVITSPAAAASSGPAATSADGEMTPSSPEPEPGSPPCDFQHDGDIWWYGAWDGYDYEMRCTYVFVDGQWQWRWQWTGNRRLSQGCRPEGSMRE